MAEVVGQTQVYEDEDVDDEDDDESEESGCCCTHCDSDLLMSEEVFLLRVVTSSLQGRTLLLHDILDANGDYVYAPAFFCFDCWESEQEDLQEVLEDVPPVVDVAGHLECDLCRSDILQGETLAVAHFGEIHWSERAPSGCHTPKFVEMQKDIHICISCLTLFEEGRSVPIWEGGIKPLPNLEVCGDGLFARCWRHGNCECQTALAGKPNG